VSKCQKIKISIHKKIFSGEGNRVRALKRQRPYMCHKYHIKHTCKECNLDGLKSGSQKDTNDSETSTCAVPAHALQTNTLLGGVEEGTTKALLYTLPRGVRAWCVRRVTLLLPTFLFYFFGHIDQGLLLIFCRDMHQGVGWLRVGERYYFFLHEIFCTADPFPGTNCSQFWRENLLGPKNKGDMRRIADENVYRKAQRQFSQISERFSVGRENYCQQFRVTCSHVLEDSISFFLSSFLSESKQKRK